jgi:mono/diheme cytochrome c family protein
MLSAKTIFAASGALCALAALFFPGCATGTGGAAIAPPVTPALVAASHGASSATLEEGRRIFFGPCASCHAPDPVSKYTLSRWEGIVAEMTPKAKLTPARHDALLAYVRAAKSASTPR